MPSALGLCSFVLTAALTHGAPLKELRDPETFAALWYSPPGAGAEPLPLLLYLHGAGESGSDVRGLISEGATGTPPVELEHGTALPVLAKRFVVVAPQTSHGWDTTEVHKFLDFLLARKVADMPPIDASRCYVTGHSMGGGGALLAAATQPRRFAAVVAVAPSHATRPAELAGVPTWCFHGKNDVVVPSHVSEHLVGRLKANGANDSDARLTLYDAAPAPKGWPDYDGHGSTIPAYATAEMWRWLLEHRLPAGRRLQLRGDVARDRW